MPMPPLPGEGDPRDSSLHKPSQKPLPPSPLVANSDDVIQHVRLCDRAAGDAVGAAAAFASSPSSPSASLLVRPCEISSCPATMSTTDLGESSGRSRRTAAVAAGTESCQPAGIGISNCSSSSSSTCDGSISGLSGRENDDADSGHIEADQGTRLLCRGEAEGGEPPPSPTRDCCRICFEDGECEALIAPCQCSGTQKFVHRSCLDSWRAAKEGFAFSHCTECRSSFLLRVNVPPDRWWRSMQYRACVAMDNAVVFTAVQVVVASIALVAYMCFGGELAHQFGYDNNPNAFLALVAVVSVLVGILYGSFVVIIFSDAITRRHYHILQCQELTKEYIVEDLSTFAGEGDALSRARRSSSHLPRQAEQELASLGLL